VNASVPEINKAYIYLAIRKLISSKDGVAYSTFEYKYLNKIEYTTSTAVLSNVFKHEYSKIGVE